MPFKTFGLSDPLVQGILATGYTAPTEIQTQAIPAAIEGKDIIACAQTGTGKTAAFVLPILDRLSHGNAPKKRIVRALILTPTRELAGQIEQAITEYGRFLKLKSLAIYGGVKIFGQIKALRSGVDIVVATPGRLIDHMQRDTLNLSNVEVLVLDEADRMLDMGFVNDVKRIAKVLKGKRQTLMYSATLSKDVEALTSSLQTNPVRIVVGKQHNPIETITQHMYKIEKNQKKDLLIHLIKDQQMYSVLVFSRTKHGADKICKYLRQANIDAVPIHSNRTQGQRQKAMEGFKAGKYQVMVATDIAARGIDIDGISHVINFDVPAYAEDYVHRIGRTGRATNTGDAITFVSSEEMNHIRKIENFIGRKFIPVRCESFTYTSPEWSDKQPADRKGGKKKPRGSQAYGKRKKSSDTDYKKSTKPAEKRDAGSTSKKAGPNSKKRKYSGKNTSAAPNKSAATHKKTTKKKTSFSKNRRTRD